MALIKPDKSPQHSASFALSTNQTTTYTLRRQSFPRRLLQGQHPYIERECSPTKYPSQKQPLTPHCLAQSPSPGNYARKLPTPQKWSQETHSRSLFLCNPASFNRKTETRFTVPTLVQLKFSKTSDSLSLQQDSNLRPTDYDSGALPAELWRVRNT